MSQQSENNHKRIYEFMTSEEFHGKPTPLITSRAVWEGFQNNTTAHGIPHVRNARGPIKRGFWLLMSLTSCALLIFYAYFLFDKYFQYNVTVKVEVVSLPRMKFPAVTVCNHNPIRKNKVWRLDNPALNSLYGIATEDESENTEQVATTVLLPAETPLPQIPTDVEIPEINQAAPEPTTVEPVLTTNSTSTDTYGNGDGFRPGAGWALNGRPKREEMETFTALQEIIAEMSTEEAREVGYKRDDFILDCEYSGAFCYTSDFDDKYHNPTYGNCYTFNLGSENATEVQDCYRPGPKYGLAVTFNIDQDEYSGSVVQEAGVRIVIHSQDRMPFPEDEGISVLPGQITYVGVRLFEVERLSKPYSSCEQITRLNKERNVYEELFGVKYSNTACYKTCYQYHVITKCGCADPAYPRTGKAFGGGTYHTCKIANDEEHACMERVLADYQDDKLACDCPTACSASTFTTTTSAAAWPSQDYRGTLFDKLASQNNKIKGVLNDRHNNEKYKDNLLKAVIYFEEFNYERIDEVAAYESFNLVSDLGGILGLFIGFSVMTIAEFLELGLDLALLNIIKRCYSKTRRQTRAMSTDGSTVETVNGRKDKANIGGMSPPPPYHRPTTASSVNLKPKEFLR